MSIKVECVQEKRIDKLSNLSNGSAFVFETRLHVKVGDSKIRDEYIVFNLEAGSSYHLQGCVGVELAEISLIQYTKGGGNVDK